MREIKFRVWLPNQGRFMRKEESTYNLMDVTCGKLVFDIDEHDDEDEPKVEYFTDSSYVLMQYTGLKDKNGIEIYEGDIVKVTMDGDESIHQVRWFGEDDYPGFDLEPGFESCGNHLQETQIVAGAEIEVIGNIYEHPHLLESKNA